MVINDNKIKGIKEIILSTFHFLEENYHYVPLCAEEKSEVFFESFEVKYRNEIIRREIRISYTKGQVFEDLKHTFNASITRIPYSGIEDFFSLSVYLQSKGMDFPTELLNNFNKEDAKAILEKIAAALKEYASKIIQGEEWLETYYPRKD